MTETKRPSIWRLTVTLGSIALLSGALLGLLHQVTAPVIRQNQEERLKASLRLLLETFDNDPQNEAFTLEEFPGMRFLPARQGGTLRALAIEATSPEGYSGDVVILAGFEANGRLLRVQVLRQKETPGLGARMTEESFLRQFQQLAPESFPLSVRKDGGTVDALTAATISSRAFLKALNAARQGFVAALQKLQNQEAP